MERSETKEERACEVWEHGGRELRIFPGRSVNGRQRATVIMGPFTVAEIAELLIKRMEVVTRVTSRPKRPGALVNKGN